MVDESQPMSEGFGQPATGIPSYADPGFEESRLRYAGAGESRVARDPSPRSIAIAGLLFALTGASTWLAGGTAYAFSILAILLCHEMGHYLMCRRYRVPATLPLFLPLPFLSPFGTLGAVIRMKARIRNRKVLYDIGIAGPLAGIAPALAAVIWGLAHSTVVERGHLGPQNMLLGSSLLFEGLERLVFPGLRETQDVLLHPVAFAGWAGLFVTALNLLPVGQLDGGHVLYGLFGRRSFYVSWAIAGLLAVAGFFFPGWWVLLALLVIFRIRHPATLDEDLPLDRRRILLGVFALAFFVVSFIPVPIRVP